MRTLDTHLDPHLHLPADPEPPAQAPAAPDPERLAAVCRRIALMLGNSDFEASTEWLEHAPLLRQGLGDDFGPIASAIENFGFESALQHLHMAAAARAIPLEEGGSGAARSSQAP